MPAAEGDAAIGAVVLEVHRVVGPHRRLVVCRGLVGGILLMPRVRLPVRGIDAHANQLLAERRHAEITAQQLAFGAGDQSDGARRRGHVAPQREAKDGTEAQAGKQNAALRRHRHPVYRRPVNEREEDERVIRMVLPLEMLDESRRGRPEAAHPFHLLGPRTRRRENAIRMLPERVDVVRLVHREAPHQHAADAVRALAVLVLPGAPVARRGRQHLDVVLQAQLLGDQTARVLGAARDLAAVARRDERELHAAAPDGSSSSTCAAGRSDRCRRASQPGSFSMRCGGGFDESCANMSRYFRSITGQL